MAPKPIPSVAQGNAHGLPGDLFYYAASGLGTWLVSVGRLRLSVLCLCSWRKPASVILADSIACPGGALLSAGAESIRIVCSSFGAVVWLLTCSTCSESKVKASCSFRPAFVTFRGSGDLDRYQKSLPFPVSGSKPLFSVFRCSLLPAHSELWPSSSPLLDLCCLCSNKKYVLFRPNTLNHNHIPFLLPHPVLPSPFPLLLSLPSPSLSSLHLSLILNQSFHCRYLAYGSFPLVRTSFQGSVLLPQPPLALSSFPLLRGRTQWRSFSWFPHLQIVTLVCLQLLGYFLDNTYNFK